jgi:hypothetical protein
MDDAAIFCRQVRARSAEHQRAIFALLHANAPGMLVGLLRQELDSMVRVIFVLAQKDAQYRRQLLAASVRGERWKKKGGKGYVTDREMVDLATKLKQWTQSVYKFGCAFIHLSSLHDHAARDPVKRLSGDERKALFEHLRHYHGGPPPDRETFDDVVCLVPMVFDKIAGNLDSYLKTLEEGRGLGDR